MAAFEITHFARNGANTTGTVWVERTGRVYTFLAFPNGNVMLARGTHPVPANHLRDVRHFVSKRFAAVSAAPAMVQQQCQPQQADAGRRGFLRTALAAGLLAATAAPAAAARPTLRGDDTARLPDHAALWSRMPLPFTPAEAWHLLSPATQAEIGAAVIGMELAQYVYGDGRSDPDQFTDDALRSDASDVSDAILNAMPDRLWTLLPDLYGPDGDHPAWALAAGMVHPLGAVLPERETFAVTFADEPDPILAALADREAASCDLAQIGADTAGDESAEPTARWWAGDRRLDAADNALRTTTPTTLAGLSALARHYAATSCDPDGEGLTHLAETLADFADA